MYFKHIFKKCNILTTTNNICISSCRRCDMVSDHGCMWRRDDQQWLHRRPACSVWLSGCPRSKFHLWNGMYECDYLYSLNFLNLIKFCFRLSGASWLRHSLNCTSNEVFLTIRYFAPSGAQGVTLSVCLTSWWQVVKCTKFSLRPFSGLFKFYLSAFLASFIGQMEANIINIPCSIMLILGLTLVFRFAAQYLLQPTQDSPVIKVCTHCKV